MALALNGFNQGDVEIPWGSPQNSLMFTSAATQYTDTIILNIQSSQLNQP